METEHSLRLEFSPGTPPGPKRLRSRDLPRGLKRRPMPEGGSNAGLGFEAGFGLWWRVPGRGRVRVRVRSQGVPGAKPTAGLWSPPRGELKAQGTLSVRIPLWLPRPQMLFLPWSRRPPESFRAAAAGPGKRHGELPASMPSQSAPLQDPRRVVLSDFGIGSPWGKSLS